MDAPYFTGTVEALCLQDPLFDLIIGNVSGARKPDDPDPEWNMVAAVVTRGQARTSKDPKPLKVQDVTSKMAVSKEDLVKWQGEDASLEKFREMKEEVIRGKFVVKFEKHRGVLYRIRQRRDAFGETWKQILLASNA